MEIKSRKSLPLEKRAKASKEELLKALEEAEEQLEIYLKSPYADSYLTLYFQIKDLNKQLKIADTDTTVTITSEGVDVGSTKIRKGRLDLFADKDSKEYDRAFKYFDNSLAWHNTLDELRKKMTPEELKSVEQTSEVDDVRQRVKNR